MQKLKLFDQFEAHTLVAFKQHIFLLIEDLLKSVYPRPTFLQCVYEGDNNMGQSWEHPPASSSALANKKIVKKPGNKVIKPASIVAAATAKKPVVAATKVCHCYCYCDKYVYVVLMGRVRSISRKMLLRRDTRDLLRP